MGIGIAALIWYDLSAGGAAAEKEEEKKDEPEEESDEVRPALFVFEEAFAMSCSALVCSHDLAMHASCSVLLTCSANMAWCNTYILSTGAAAFPPDIQGVTCTSSSNLFDM